MNSADIRAGRKSTAAGAWRLAMLLLAAVARIALAVGAYRYYRRVAVAGYLQIDLYEEQLFSDNRDLSDRDYARVQAPHLALVTSPMVIEAALQASEVKQLEIVQSRGVDAAGWLQDALEASFLHDGPVLELRLAVDPSEADEAIVLVDAVMKAYCDQVLLKEKLTDVEHLQGTQAVAQGIAAELQQRLDRLQMLKSTAADGESVEAEALLLEESINNLKRLHSDWDLSALDGKFQAQLRERKLQSQNFAGSGIIQPARRVP